MPANTLTTNPLGREELKSQIYRQLNNWIRGLEELERANLLGKGTLESGALLLLRVCYPEHDFYSAEEDQTDHPAVDILSRDKKIGVQIKLTLRAGVVTAAREKWASITQPGQLLVGATDFWLIGGDTDPRSPSTDMSNETGAWHQEEHNWWKRLPSALQLQDDVRMSMDKLREVLRLLSEELCPQAESINRIAHAIEKLHNNTAALIEKYLVPPEEDVDFLFYLSTSSCKTPTEAVDMSGMDAVIQQIEINSSVISNWIGDTQFQSNLENLIRDGGQFHSLYDRASATHKKVRDNKDDIRRGFGAPEEWVRVMTESYNRDLQRVIAANNAVLSHAKLVKNYLEKKYPDLCVR